MNRQLEIFDLMCIGWNCIIGSGFFICQAQIAQTVGPWGPALFLTGGLLCLPVALCFAELSQRCPGTGGASLYTRQAFGPRWGFVVGWVMWLSGLIGQATVALALGQNQAQALGVIAVLAGINLLGNRSGAWSNNLLALVKLLPLLLAAGLGILWLGPVSLLRPEIPLAAPPQYFAALLPVLYAYSGFEEIAVPAGEVRQAQVQVPRAIVTVLLSSALLYTLLQGLVSHCGTWSQANPLAAVFAARLPWLARALELAVLASLASVNSSIAFTTPRSLLALSQQGWLPQGLQRLYRGAPPWCILISAGLSAGLVMLKDLSQLITLSVLVALLQHLAASLACWKLRGWGGRFSWPHLATLVCAVLLLTSTPADLWGIFKGLLIGLAVSWWIRPKTG